MAQCKDCIHGEICDMFAHTRTLICTDRADKMCKMFKPVADVVPKSEVDKTIAEWAFLHADVLNKLENARAEVAREIFEEIEKQSIYHFAMRTYSISELKFAKLKKKYTEEKE